VERLHRGAGRLVSRLSVGGAFALAVLGCSFPVELPGKAPVAPVEAPAVGGTSPAAAPVTDTPASAVAASNLPPASVEGVPGWLGVRVVAEESAGGLVLPGAGPIVVLSEAWSAVPAGVAIRRVDHSGVGPAPFLRSQTARYGCDGGQDVSVASFDGTAQDPLVWLLPPDVTAEPVPLAVTDTPTARTWDAGGQRFTLSLTGPDRAELRAPDGTTVLHSTDLATQRMEGDDRSHLDLKSPFMLPQLDAAWRIGGVLVVAGRFDSYEGQHYVVYTVGATAVEHEAAYLYRCAL